MQTNALTRTQRGKNLFTHSLIFDSFYIFDAIAVNVRNAYPYEVNGDNRP